MEPMIDKDKLIERYRHTNIAHDNWWAESEMEAFKGRLTKLGVRVRDVYWSGFSSQGDGASFVGYVEPEIFFRAAKCDAEFPLLAKALGLGFDLDSANICLSDGHYVHSNMMYVNWDYPPHTSEVLELITRDELTAAVAEVENWEAKIEAETVAFEKYMQTTFRSMADAFYRDLEKEYDHQTSDEAVWSTIESSGITQGESDDDCDD